MDKLRPLDDDDRLLLARTAGSLIEYARTLDALDEKEACNGK